MENYLFNLVQKFRQVRDYMVQQGPATLRSAAGLLGNIQQAMQTAADYLEQVGPLVQFAPGSGHVDSTKAQEYLKELQAIRSELQAKQAEAEKQVAVFEADRQKELGVGVNAGLMDWLGKVDPSTQSTLLSLAVSVLTKVLLKSGVALAFGAAPKQDETHKHQAAPKK